ncbi:MAG: CDP-diacylglycerol--glycerol-3-phosphate 3-phosphatidyltransferase [Proteobacteria bacterium]|nr:CDP-diacylglycerol--glycerol-3-phosphate 3-phosphatidyltransferase [Pseudomonadota bacterium]
MKTKAQKKRIGFRFRRPKGSENAISEKKEKKRLSDTLKKDLFNIPNSITMIRIVFIPFVVVLLAQGTPGYCLIAVLCFGIAAISDFFDGYLARRLNLVSVTGKFLDPLADKLMVMAATIQLASMGWLESWIPIVILTRELAVQGLRLIAVGEGLVIAAGSGGKIKTALQLIGLIGLLVHYTYPVHLFGWDTTMNFHKVGWILLVLSIFFSLLSAWQYFRGFLKALDDQKNEG